MRVLLIDDSLVLAHAVRELFAGDAGVSVRCCWDAAQVLDEAAAFEPTVIVQNMGLEGMGCLTLLKHLSTSPATEGIPVLAIGRSENRSFRKEAFARGARDFVTGIPSPGELRVRIENLSDGFLATQELDMAYARVADLKAELEDQSRRFQHAAAIDALTEIPSWIAFDKRLTEEFNRATLDNSFLTLLFVKLESLDDFELRHGLRETDEALKRIARVINGSIKRSADLFARYSDDTFVLVMPQTPHSEATTLSMEIRWAVDDIAAFASGDVPMDEIHISVGGVTALPAHWGRQETLVAAADEALLEARTKAKDQVLVRAVVQEGRQRQQHVVG